MREVHANPSSSTPPACAAKVVFSGVRCCPCWYPGNLRIPYLYGVLREVTDMAQQNTTEAGSERVTISEADEAVDVLATNLTSAELSEFSREHGVNWYSGKKKRAKAENIAWQAPEAVVEFIEADDICEAGEGLLEALEAFGPSTLYEVEQVVTAKALKRRLADLREALAENERTYEVTSLTVNEYFVAVRITDPHQCRHRAGELGDSRFNAWLGPKGGVKRAQVQVGSHESEYTEGSRARSAWSRFCEKVADAK